MRVRVRVLERQTVLYQKCAYSPNVLILTRSGIHMKIDSGFTLAVFLA